MRFPIATDTMSCARPISTNGYGSCVVEIPVAEDSDLVFLNDPHSQPPEQSSSHSKKVHLEKNHQPKNRRRRRAPFIHKRRKPKARLSVSSRVISSELQEPRVPSSPGVGDDSFEVEEIKGHRIRFETGQPEFLLKWKGYPSSENSWEPPANLDGCVDMMNTYILEKIVMVSHSLPHVSQFVNLLPNSLREQAKLTSRQTLSKEVESESGTKRAKKNKKRVDEKLHRDSEPDESRGKLTNGCTEHHEKRKKRRPNSFRLKRLRLNSKNKKLARKLVLTTDNSSTPPDGPSINHITHTDQILSRTPSNDIPFFPSPLPVFPPSPDTLSPHSPTDISPTDNENYFSSLLLSPSCDNPLRSHDSSLFSPFSLQLSPSPQSVSSPLVSFDSPLKSHDSYPLSPDINQCSPIRGRHDSLSERSCIPKHLLSNQKALTTSSPQLTTKHKIAWSAAAKLLKTRKQNHTQKHNLPLLGVSVVKKVVKSNGLAQHNHTEEPSPPMLSENGLGVVNGHKDETHSLKVGRMPESAASLLYKELLLNWQYQLNKERGGTDDLILVENFVDRVPPPTDFKYISSSRYGANVPDPGNPLCGCECYALGKKCGTRAASYCCPNMADASFAYTKAGKVQVQPGTPIYECNSKCSCPPDCLNKVVQHGRKIPLCIFRTENGRGWGVKAVQPIKAHSFVSEYVGEVITSEEAEKRGRLYDQQGATYLFDLDFDDDNSEFTIDAAKEGNISHFFNHSCQPNLVVYSVWVESLDKRLPRIAFFTTRNISAGEELTFDYQMNLDQSQVLASPSRHKKQRMKCLCGSNKCLGYYY